MGPAAPVSSPVASTALHRLNCPQLGSCGTPLMLPWPQVMGSEGKGLRTLVRRCCHALLAVDSPLGQAPAGVDSLNVGVAAGVLLHRLLTAQAGAAGVADAPAAAQQE